jgi:hypothetical protein
LIIENFLFVIDPFRAWPSLPAESWRRQAEFFHMTNDKFSIARKAARKAGLSSIVLTVDIQSLHLPESLSRHRNPKK